MVPTKRHLKLYHSCTTHGTLTALRVPDWTIQVVPCGSRQRAYHALRGFCLNVRPQDGTLYGTQPLGYTLYGTYSLRCTTHSTIYGTNRSRETVYGTLYGTLRVCHRDTGPYTVPYMVHRGLFRPSSTYSMVHSTVSCTLDGTFVPFQRLRVTLSGTPLGTQWYTR